MLAGNHGLNRGELLDDAAQQRALVHVVKAIGRLQRAHQVLNQLDVRGADQVGDQFLVAENQIAQLAGFAILKPVILDGGHHRAEHFRAEDIGEAVGTVLAHPKHQVSAGVALADEFRKAGLELFEVAGVDQNLDQFPHQPEAGLVDQLQVGVDPGIRVGLAKRLESEFLFGCGEALDQTGQIIRFFIDVVCCQFTLLRLATESDRRSSFPSWHQTTIFSNPPR